VVDVSSYILIKRVVYPLICSILLIQSEFCILTGKIGELGASVVRLSALCKSTNRPLVVFEGVESNLPLGFSQ
jgi:hypothetical protein